MKNRFYANCSIDTNMITRNHIDMKSDADQAAHRRAQLAAAQRRFRQRKKDDGEGLIRAFLPVSTIAELDIEVVKAQISNSGPQSRSALVAEKLMNKHSGTKS